MKDSKINKKWTEYRKTLLLFGFCCSLFIVFTAFEITVPIYKTEAKPDVIEPLAEIKHTPITYQRKVHKLPPPKKMIEKTIIDIPPKIVTEDIDYIESDVQEVFDELEDDFSDTPFIEEKNEGKIEIDEPKEEELVIIAQRMPVFGDCGHIMDDNERKTCSEKSLYDYIYKNVKFTTIAKENNIEGQVVAQIVVNKKGQVSNIEILRHPGGGLDQEVLKMLENMPDWEAGKNNMRPVNVRFTIPITFKLN